MEVFRNIPNTNYSISKLGLFKNNITGKIMIGQMSKGHYPHVYLNGKNIYIHRLVGMVWVQGYFDKAEINHKNALRIDPFYKNLEWCTSSQNRKHAVDMGLLPNPSKGKFGKEHHGSKQIFSICEISGKIKYYGSVLEACRKELISTSMIYSSLTNNKVTKKKKYFYVSM